MVWEMGYKEEVVGGKKEWPSHLDYFVSFVSKNKKLLVIIKVGKELNRRRKRKSKSPSPKPRKDRLLPCW